MIMLVARISGVFLAFETCRRTSVYGGTPEVIGGQNDANDPDVISRS
jgi:hypothetical protein